MKVKQTQKQLFLLLLSPLFMVSTPSITLSGNGPNTHIPDSDFFSPPSISQKEGDNRIRGVIKTPTGDTTRSGMILALDTVTPSAAPTIFGSPILLITSGTGVVGRHHLITARYCG